MKRFVSIILAFLMIFGLSAVQCTAAEKIPSEKVFIQKLAELAKKYPTGSKWTGSYKENGYSYATQCRGYVNLIAYEVFGSSEYTSGGSFAKSTTMGTLYAGDMVRISNSKGPDGHSIFITKVDGGDIYYTDCNWIGADTVRWDGHYTKDELQKRFNYKFHFAGNKLTGTHICDKSKNIGAAAAHPHYTQYVCSVCGKTWEDESQPNLLPDSCYDCRPTPEAPVLKYDVNKKSVTFSWNKCENASSYDLYIKDFDEQDYSLLNIKQNVCATELEPGFYYAWCRAYSNDKYSESDTVYFSVTDESDLEYASPLSSIRYNGGTYELYDIPVDWHTAKEWCEQKNAHIVTISSYDEQKAVERLIADSGFEGRIWLGATVFAGGADWIDGSIGSYGNWAENQPQDGKYVYLDTDLSNKWASGFSSSECFILEREPGDTNPDDFGYEILDDGTVSITSYYGEESEITVPDTLDGKKVTSVGAYALVDSEFKLITVPESVTAIDETAFGDDVRSDLTVRCVEDSAAHKFAVEKGIKFELIDTSVIYGDADGSGKINIFDVLVIQKHLAGQKVKIDTEAADVTHDGKVNIFDTLKLCKYLAGQHVDLNAK